MKEHSQEWLCHKRLKDVGPRRSAVTKERKSGGRPLLHEAERKEARWFMDFVWD
jgi:hypothetical protein